jgi:flagellin
MALAIATNTGALMAAASATSVNKDMETSMERLSTGKRINSAADDAAGVAIASRLTSEIRGTNQAIRNAQDGQALIDTAEGAHKEIENILQRMRELAVQSANDTNDVTDRSNLDAEMQQLVSEIDRISGVTTWAGQNLLDGSKTGGFTFQIGGRTNSGDALTVAINSVSAAALGLSGSGSTASASSSLTNTTFASSFNSATDAISITTAATGQAAVAAQGAVTGVVEVQTFTTPTVTDTETYSVTMGDGTQFSAVVSTDIDGLITNLNAAASAAGAGVTFDKDSAGTSLVATFASVGAQDAISITRSAKVEDTSAASDVFNLSAAGYDGSADVTLTVGGVTLTAASANFTTAATDAASLVAALQADANYANSGFTISKDGTNGSQINVTRNTSTATSAVLSGPETSIGAAVETTAGTAAQAAVIAQDAVSVETVSIAMGSQTFDVELDTSTYATAAAQATQIASVLNSNSTFTAQFSATANNGTISFTGLADTTFNVTTAANSTAALATIDSAISTVNTQRANLGATSNRLDNTVSNLTNVVINLEGGRGRIEDADFAAESTSLAKSQILQQASTAMLAQANASKQSVLSLLQG